MIDKQLNDELRSIYNPDGSELRYMQLCILEILKIVEGICRRNNITYWLGSGTLLGAVRHGGFIPWDDDIDIEILRKDRNRFIKACNRELPPHLHIQCHKTESDFYLNILKVRDDRTDIGEKVLLGQHGNFAVNYKYKGYFIDIFCEEPCLPKLLKLSNAILTRVFIARYVKNHSRRYCNFLWHCMNIMNWMFRVVGKIFSDKKTLYHGYSSCFNSKRSVNNIFPTTDIYFEDMKAMAPHKSDSYLKEMFGDYMALPPEKLRSGHHFSN